MEPATLDLSATLTQAWEGYLRVNRQTSRNARDYVYSSGSRDCVRQMALDLIHPEDQPLWTADQLERFERGKEREAAVVARLMQIGPRCSPPFEVIEGQSRFQIPDRDGTIVIVGKIDGQLSFKGTKRRPIFEVKSGESFRYVETVEDLDNSPWTRRGADQLLSYAFATGEPEVLLVIDRPGLPGFLVLELEKHLERVERFLQAARWAVDARFKRRELPPFTETPTLCRRCDHFGKSCAPPVDYGQGLKIITDERLIRAAEVFAKDHVTAKECDRAEKVLKEALKGTPEALVGPLVYRGKPGKSTTFEIPDEIKEQYKKVDLEGRWIASLEPHGITD